MKEHVELFRALCDKSGQIQCPMWRWVFGKKDGSDFKSLMWELRL